jgi:hypothetical protein
LNELNHEDDNRDDQQEMDEAPSGARKSGRASAWSGRTKVGRGLTSPGITSPWGTVSPSCFRTTRTVGRYHLPRYSTSWVQQTRLKRRVFSIPCASHCTLQYISSPAQSWKLLVFRTYGIRELHRRVIRCNTCSSIIVSTHYPETSSSSLMNVSAFSKMSNKCSLRQ